MVRVRTFSGALRTWTDFDKETLASSEGLAFSIQDARFRPAFPALRTSDASFHANRLAARYRQKILNLQMARHGGDAGSAHCLAHGLIQQRGDHAAVQVAGVAAKIIGNGGVADNGTVVGEQKLQLQSMRIGDAAAKAAVMRSMFERCEVFFVSLHPASEYRPRPRCAADRS